jgi:DNA-binding LacI/PurR family transcriptional regulator
VVHLSGPTLRDVAKMAGVSIGTASQAINNRPNVMQDTRARVIDAARSLGYPIRDTSLNPCETNLSMVGMLVKHDYGEPFLVNPFYSHIQMGVENECRKHGINLMYANVEVDYQNRPIEWPAMVREEGLDGLILIGMVVDETTAHIGKLSQGPIVLIDGYSPGSAYDSVVTDNVQGARLAVDYLIDHGHRDVGLLGWESQSPPSIDERRKGYEQALRARGIETMQIEESKPGRSEVAQAAKNLLQRAPGITAIFATNDEVAIGVMNGIRALGLRVPEDVSIVGFDNIDLAREIMPALTTIHVPKSWMGAIGVRLLEDRVNNPNQPKLTVSVSVQLITRESVHTRK